MSLGDHEPRLVSLGPARLFDLYLALRTPRGHEVGFRGAERRVWGKADGAVRKDIATLVSAADPDAKKLPKKEADRADAISALKKQAGDAEARTVLASFLQSVRARLEADGEAAAASVHAELALVGAGRDELDWAHAEKVLSAWHDSLGTSDGDGDEEHLPEEALELCELYDELSDAKARAKDRAKATKAEKKAAAAASGPARKYSPKEHFPEGTRIAHPKFGEGTVVASSTGIRVLFDDGAERALAQAPRPATLITPMEKPKPAAAPVIPAAKVKKLAPDPRLSEDHGAEAFTHLAKTEEPDEDAD
jgi:hypothetical protein